METGWTDDYLNLRFVVPGIRNEDLEVTVQGHQLVLRGERKAPEGFGKEGSVFYRLPYGRFERVVELPHNVDSGKLDAYLHDGVLDVLIPIAEGAKPKKIEITAGKEPKAIAA